MELILFGAGASYGSGCRVPCAPPLGPQLFDALVAGFDSWASLPDDVKARFSNDKFETGFLSLRFSEYDVKIPSLLRDMALYFLQFNSKKSGLYVDLIRAMKKHKAQVVYATLNYDLLLEEACDLVFDGFDYGPGMPKPASAGVPMVIKVHGSPNFLPKLPSGMTLHNVRVSDASDANVGGGIDIVAIEQAQAALTAAAAAGNDLMVPAMAMYAPGKQVLYSPDPIRHLQQIYAAKCRAASKIFIVGARLSVEDTHVWQPIEQAGCEVVFVNPSAADRLAFEEWARDRTVAGAAVDGGLGEFVGDSAKRWATSAVGQ